MKIKITAIIGMFLLGASFVTGEEKTTIRFGHFPNITHAQGVIAHALSRQGKGWFEERLGTNVEIQWFTYNAGPSAMEAIFAGSLDLTYVEKRLPPHSSAIHRTSPAGRG
jgi:NitT/TauT family transport system substrate-binding protein